MTSMPSPNDAIFDPIRNIRGDSNDYCVIEGEEAVRNALKCGLKLQALFYDNDFYNHHQDDLKDTQCHQVTRKIFKEVLGFNFHRHVIALAPKLKTSLIDHSSPPYLILNGLTSPENVGTLMRTACAFGIKTIIYDSQTCSPYLRRCIRVSMGHIFSLNVVKSDSLMNDIEKLKKKGIHIYALETSQKSSILDNIEFITPSALILGSEGHGIQDSVLSLSDTIVEIPMKEGIPSLNVSQSGAIALYKMSLVF